MKTLRLTLFSLYVVAGIGLSFPQHASAGVFEISGNFSFSENSFGESNFQWTRRWGLSLGYSFWALSEIEFSIQDVLYRTVLNSIEDTTFHDQIYSVDWVQALSSKHSVFQPYVKSGVGQLNREAYGTYAGGTTPPALFGSLTVVLGAGVRIFLLQFFALRAEGTTYLTDGVLSSWQNNFSFNAGFSIYL